ncbi:AarF/ABC1/UbiB kinase family protein [Candidatus Roizmanbacteria bacterium]|nr:AarF/ABC1/UbiB kinase family protein [Candidatus Roizmanbacteria bacterium]
MIRLLHIIGVIAKYSFLFLLSRLKLRSRLSPKDIRSFFEETGGSFIKFGQLLAMRVEIFQREYVVELMDLFDHVKPFPYEEVRHIFKKELGVYPDELLPVFEKKPFASASFGQVHAAKLKDGTVVAVKVQRPGIQEDVLIDFIVIDLLSSLLDIFYKIEAMPWKHFAEEFKLWTNRELNYQIEAEFAQKIYANIVRSHIASIVVPKTYHRYTTQKILVQEYIDAIPLSRIFKEIKKGRLTRQQLESRGINLPETTKVLVNELLRQYFFDNEFHADPHPGNILLLPHNRVALIDFGIVGRSFAAKTAFARFIYHMSANEFETACKYFFAFAGQEIRQIIVSLLPATVDQKDIDQFIDMLAHHFAETIKSIEGKYRKDLKVKKTDYSAMMVKILKYAQRYNIALPKDVIIFLRAISMLGFLIKEMDYNVYLSKKIMAFFTLYPIESLPVSEEAVSYQRISRERAVERLNQWLTYLIEIDPKLYQVVSGYIAKYTHS